MWFLRYYGLEKLYEEKWYQKRAKEAILGKHFEFNSLNKFYSFFLVTGLLKIISRYNKNNPFLLSTYY